MTKSKIKKVTLSLDEETLEILSQLSNIGYGSISASIRILVKKLQILMLKDLLQFL